MTTDPRGVLGGRVGATRFQTYLGAIIAVFGLLFALQAVDALVAGWPSMSGPAGAVTVALVVGSVLLGTAAGVLPARARRLFLGAALLFCAAVAVWASSPSGPVPTTTMPLLIALMPVQAGYLAGAFRRPAVPIGAAVLLSAGIAVVLVDRGRLGVLAAVEDALFGVAVSVVLVVMIAAVRRGVERADAAQQAALAGYGRARFDDATESERVRTDALVHDSVLTTFLAAATAHDAEAEDLARRMAANALRVLAHVTRSETVGPAVPFGKALGDAADRLDPLLPAWDLQVGALADLVLPEEAGEAVIASMLLAMAGSLDGAPGALHRTIRLSELGPDGIRVVLADDGPGFDPFAADDVRAEPLREVVRVMRAVDGRADVRTAPTTGTVVTLSWGSVVVAAASPRPDRSEVTA